jgi:hypothetical protein
MPREELTALLEPVVGGHVAFLEVAETLASLGAE